MICAVTVALAATQSWAQLYEFVPMADTTLPAPTGTFTSFDDDPSVRSGAAFVGNYPGGSGVFTRSFFGGVTTLAKTGDAAPSGVFTSFGDTAGRDFTVSYHATYGASQSGIFQQTGNGPRTTIAKTGDAAPMGVFTGFGKPAMGNLATMFFPNATQDNMTAFRANFVGGSGIFTGIGGALTTIVKEGDPTPLGGTFETFGNPSLSAVTNSMGISVPGVAFRGTYNGGSSLFLAADGAITPIALVSFPGGDPFLLHGHAAFTAFGNIYLGAPASVFTEVAVVGQPAPTGTFTSFGDPILTFQGVGFEATYGGGKTGIFGRYGFGTLGPLHPIVKTGDVLFGSQVLSVSLAREGGRSSHWGLAATGVGDFAFHYILADGRQGIAVALAAPEPATASLTTCAALAALNLRRRTRLVRAGR
jgi:hypothetical protein